MSRHATRRRLRIAALALCALALWLLPTAFPSRPDPAARVAGAPVGQRPAPVAKPRLAPPIPSGPPPPADTVFTLNDGPGIRRTYAVALDELYFPARPAQQRVASIAPQPHLPALLAHASLLASVNSVVPSASPTPAAAHAESAPRLVLYPVGAPRNAITRRIVNPRIDVALASADAPSPAPRPDLGIVAWERPAYAPDRAIARIVGDAAQPLRAAYAAASLPGVRFARPLLARQHFPRLIPNDPLFKDQWHLRNTRQQGGKAGVDIRAVPAWDTTTGAGIVIGVVDDGVDLTHPDLAPALDNSLGYDWNGNDSNPSAEGGYEDGDDHGTAVSGLAAARGNNAVGVSGSAPSATLAALRLIAAPSDDSEDASAMSWRDDVIPIKNNSWGPSDSQPNLHPAGDLWLSSVQSGVSNGRGGLGTLFFWAAGNGQDDRDQGPLDGYASARPVIAIAAINNKGIPTAFSEGGPHIVAAAAGDASAGVVTTDRLGDNGYNSTDYGYPGEYAANIDYTKTFGGTSAATPIAAGVGALLLATRPDLGWRDVKEIFLRTSTKLQPSSTDWLTRHAGDTTRPIKHHPRLGGGHINALDALALAKTWVPLGNEETIVATPIFDPPLSPGPQAIPDKDSNNSSLTLKFDIPSFYTPLRVEHAVLTLNITHQYRSELEIALISASGTVARFTEGASALVGQDFADYPFTSVRQWGENSHFPAAPSQRWAVRIRDAVSGDTGILHSASLTLYGTRLAVPELVSAPPAQTLATGSTLVLRAAFTGGNLSYEWQLNGRPIPGANAAEYRLANFTAKAAGTYTCKAVNVLGIAYADTSVALDDTPRAVFTTNSGAPDTLDFNPFTAGQIALWKVTGLPSGMKLDPLTGLASGRPTKPGQYKLLVTATATDGTITRVPLTFEVEPVADYLTGDYVAHVSRDAAINSGLGGYLTLKVAPNGAATGTVRLGRTTYPFSGFFGDEEGNFPLEVTLAKPGLRLALEIDGDESHATVTGTLAPASAEAPPASATIDGARAPWKAKVKPATAYVGAVAAAFVPEAESTPALGASVVTYTVAADGRATWLITPADGSPALSGSAPLTDRGVLLAYAPYANASGSLLAHLPTPTAESPALPSGAFIDWARNPAPALAAPDGFGSTRFVSHPGSGRYTKPASGTRILGRTSDTDPLHALVADSPEALSLASPLSTGVTITSTNTLKVAAPNPPKLALSFAATTGRVSGSHVLAGPVRTARVTTVLLPYAEEPVALGFSFAPAASGISAQSKVFRLAPPAE